MIFCLFSMKYCSYCSTCDIKIYFFLKQIEKQNISGCDISVWFVAALTMWSIDSGKLNFNLMSHSYQPMKKSYFFLYNITLLCLFQRFSHFLFDAKMAVCAPTKPSITVSVSMIFNMFYVQQTYAAEDKSVVGLWPLLINQFSHNSNSERLYLTLPKQV